VVGGVGMKTALCCTLGRVSRRGKLVEEGGLGIEVLCCTSEITVNTLMTLQAITH